MKVYMNPVEPAPIGFRAPAGLALSLQVDFLTQNDQPVDPTPLYPQLIMMPHTQYNIIGFDIYTLDAVNGRGICNIPSTVLGDRSGYSLEMYRRTEDGTPLAM